MINTHLQSACLEQEFHIHHKERFKPNQTKPTKGLESGGDLVGTGWARGKSDCTAEDAWQMGAHAFSLTDCRGAEEAILRGEPMKQGAGAHAVSLKGCGGEEEPILRGSKLMKQGAGERTKSPTRQVERTISNRKTLKNSTFFLFYLL